MIGIKDMEMPNNCMGCKLTYIDECGDFYICGITHKSVVDLYNEEHYLKRNCPLIEIKEGE